MSKTINIKEVENGYIITVQTKYREGFTEVVAEEAEFVIQQADTPISPYNESHDKILKFSELVYIISDELGIPFDKHSEPKHRLICKCECEVES